MARPVHPLLLLPNYLGWFLNQLGQILNLLTPGAAMAVAPPPQHSLAASTVAKAPKPPADNPHCLAGLPPHKLPSPPELGKREGELAEILARRSRMWTTHLAGSAAISTPQHVGREVALPPESGLRKGRLPESGEGDWGDSRTVH